MNTDRFHYLRKGTLSKVFSKSSITGTWRNVVKKQLRDDIIVDLFDYYDFNYSISSIAKVLNRDMVSGQYFASKPIVYKVEKKHGICRHIVHLSPVDALVLQCLTNCFVGKVLAAQPSRNAFFSRDHSAHILPHEISIEGSDIPWREQWKLFQKQIYNFATDKKFIVTTDLANYFDSISLDDLKAYLSTLVSVDEVIVDLLFNTIRTITWVPDYMPLTGKGLPVINIEPIRILAHCYLFEVDTILERRTKKCFVRWMDDIDFGSDSLIEANQALNSISDVLKSRGLSLNQSKTKILDYRNGETEFCIQENRYIDSVDEKIKNGTFTDGDKTELRANFKKYIRLSSRKSWDKIVKRTLTLFSKSKDHFPLRYLPKLFASHPTFRPSIFYYLTSIGYGSDTRKIVLEIVDATSSYDDVAYFFLVKCLVQWSIPRDKVARVFLRAFDDKLLSKIGKFSSQFDFYCLILFRSKYMQSRSLFSFIKKFEPYWENYTFLRRQVLVILLRLRPKFTTEIDLIFRKEAVSGYTSTSSLIALFYEFSSLKTIPYAVGSYLFPGERQGKAYELNRFFVLCSILQSKDLEDRRKVFGRVRKHISDAYFLRIVQEICPDFEEVNVDNDATRVAKKS